MYFEQSYKRSYVFVYTTSPGIYNTLKHNPEHSAKLAEFCSKINTVMQDYNHSRA